MCLLSIALPGCSALKGPGFGNPYPDPDERKWNKRLVKFQEADFESFRGKGTGTITGDAFLRTRGGDIKLGAGLEVILYPATEYTSEMLNREILGTERLESMDDRISAYVRTTRADSRGQFEFAKLPPGEYFLICLIQWEIPRMGTAAMPTFSRGKMYLTPGYYTYTESTGGWAYGKAKVGENETVKVLVTR